MNKIIILSSALSRLGLISESIQLISLIKLADSRGSIVNQLHMTKEQADFFHNISTQRSFDLARWFREWFEKKIGVSGAKYRDKIKIIDIPSFEELFYNFRQDHTLLGAELSEEEEEEGGERRVFDFLDTILDPSLPLFNKVKRKSLDDAFSDFKDYIIMENFVETETEYHRDEDGGEDLVWYDVGTQCNLVAAFLKNCGRLSYLNSGDYRGAFTMMALKNKKGIPLAVVTVGEVYDEEGNPINIVTSFDSAKEPSPPKILDALFDMVRSKGLTFANLIFESQLSASGEPLKFLAAEEDLSSILGAGFEVKDIEM